MRRVNVKTADPAFVARRAREEEEAILKAKADAQARKVAEARAKKEAEEQAAREKVVRAGPLQGLAADLDIRSPAKLFAAARARRIPVTLEDSKEALSKNVGRQLFAPKPRSLGHSAAEGPGERLQADLIDFSNNANQKQDHGGHKYALAVGDVYTRRLVTEPLRTKAAFSVHPALRAALEKLGAKSGILTTDQGKEFSGLDNALSRDVVHREKDLKDRNAISVVDRQIQELKRSLGSRVASKGGSWSQHLADATKAYNERPQSAVHGPPNQVTENGPQAFFVAQDNAEKFTHNQTVTNRRVEAVKAADAFRAPLKEDRSFRPAYGKEQALGRVLPGNAYVTDTAGNTTLLKNALPAAKGTGNQVANMLAPRRQGLGRVRPNRGPAPGPERGPGRRGPAPPLPPVPEEDVQIMRVHREGGSTGSGGANPRKVDLLTPHIQNHQPAPGAAERAVAAAETKRRKEEEKRLAEAKREEKRKAASEKEWQAHLRRLARM